MDLPAGFSMLEIGRAAEHLVVADLILQGVPAFLTDQGLAYDVVADVKGKLLRVQVKAACNVSQCNSAKRASRLSYRWSVRRVGKKGRRSLSDLDCDIVALVALDIRVIAYLPLKVCRQTVELDAPGGRIARIGRGGPRKTHTKAVDQFPFSEAIA